MSLSYGPWSLWREAKQMERAAAAATTVNAAGHESKPAKFDALKTAPLRLNDKK